MSDPASRLLPFGELEVIEVYSHYDFPRFFALRSSLYADVRVVALCIADDEDAETADFLYVCMSVGRFRAVRSGGIPLREAIEDADPSQLWRLRLTFTEEGPVATGSVTRFSDLTEKELPSPEARMSLATETAPSFEPVRDVVLRSRDLGRSVIAVELGTAQHKRTEFPLKPLGKIQMQLQDLVLAIGQEIQERPTARGAVPRKLAESLQLASVPVVLAASYVFVVTPDLEGTGQIFEDDLVQASIADLRGMLDACSSSSGELVRETVKARAPRTRSKFRELLESVRGASSSIGLVTARRGSAEILESHVSAEQVRDALDAMDLDPLERDVVIERGVLWGLDTMTGTFHITDAVTGADYKGKSSPELKSRWSAVNVGSAAFVRAEITESREVERLDDIEPKQYTLVHLEEREAL